jgi:hypothetical protein
LLTGKLIVVLSYLQLVIDLPSACSHLLILLISLLLIGEELHSWLGYYGPHRDRRDGFESRSVLWCWCSGDGVNQGHHVAPSGGGDPQLPPAAEVAPSSSEESSRVVCRDGDSLYTIPTNTALESHSLERDLGGQGDRQ